MPSSTTVMIVAGEASGDQHAANLFLELKKQLPTIKGMGMGSQHMREAGIDIRHDSSDIAVMGLAEVVKSYPKIKRVLKQMQTIVCQERPDLLICVDYKEFNFRLARHAKACGIKVLFYISPQVWAWRPGRVKKYAQAVDRMAVIFPFEVDFYQQHNIPVRYVGHPLTDKVYPTLGKQEVLKQFDLKDNQPVIGLLPGSRSSEIERLMPVIINTCQQLKQCFPECQFLLFLAKSANQADILQQLKKHSLTVTLIKKQSYDAMQCCDAMMTSSGTATLEIALMGVPMAILYRLSPLTYQVAKRMVQIPDIGLPNIIAGKRIVQEYIQDQADPVVISAEIEKILTDPDYRQQMIAELNEVKQQLGSTQRSSTIAALALEMLAEKH